MLLGLSKKQMIISGVVLVLVVIMGLFIFFRTRAAYVVPDTSATVTTTGPAKTAYDTYISALDTCTTNFATAIVGGLTDSTPSRDTCIDTATVTYVKARCAPLGGDHAGNPTAKSQWDTDKTNIQKAYIKVINDVNGRAGATQIGQSGGATAATPAASAASGTGAATAAAPLKTGADADAWVAHTFITAASTGVTATATVPAAWTTALIDAYENTIAVKAINLARNADIAAATRKYIATVCEDFYTMDAITSTPAQGAIDIAAVGKYKAITFPLMPDTAAINAITPIIKKWLPFWIQRAAIPASDATAVSGTSATADLNATTILTAGALSDPANATPMSAASSTTTTQNSRAKMSGATDPSGLQVTPLAASMTMATMQNWHLARMYGPLSIWAISTTETLSGYTHPTGAGSLTWGTA